MRRHAVVRHRAPRVILRGGLGEPDVARVAGELAALERAHNGVAVADLAARRVHEVRAALHRADQLVVEQVLGLGWSGELIVTTSHTSTSRLDVRVAGGAQLLLDRPPAVGGGRCSAGFTSNGFSRRSTAEPMRPAPTVPTCMPSRSYERATQSAMFQPPSTHPDRRRGCSCAPAQDQHDDVLGHADAVAVGHLGDGDAAVDRGLEIDVVGADAGGDRELELRRLGDPLGGQVGGPERLGDDDVGVGQLAFEDASRGRPCRR